MRSPARAIMGATIAWLLHGPVPQAVAGSIFASVEGYQVLDSEKSSDPQPCQMVRSYTDPKQQGSGKGLFFSQLQGGNIVVTLVYTRWSWVKGSPPKTRFQIDGQVHAPLTVWFADASSLGALFADALIAKLGEGKRIVINVPNGNVDFDLTGFRPAFETLQRCNRAARPGPGPQAAVPPRSGPSPKREDAAPPADAAPSPSSMSMEEKLAVIHALTRHQLWAIATCGLRPNAEQRTSIDFLTSTLSHLPKTFQAALDETFAKMKASDCPSAAFLDRHLRLLVGSGVDKMVAETDENLRRQFLAIHAAAKAAPPADAGANAATTADPPAAFPATTEELRVIAYFAGVMLEDGLARCDVATTPRQRAAIAEKVAALRLEMQDLDAPARDKAAAQRCPEAGDRDAVETVRSFVAKSPEAFAADWNEKNGGATLTGIRGVLAELRPAASGSVKAEPARETAYLYGLVLRDVIKECDIRTTAKQRAGFEAKMESLQTDLASGEPALAAKKDAFTACPSAERIAEMETALPVLIEKSPEEFAAAIGRPMKGKATD